MEQDFLLLFGQIIRRVGLTYILVYTAGWIAEQKALEQLSSGGFIYRCISKSLFVQLNVNRCPAEDSLNDFLAALDGSPDLFCKQACSLQ